MVPIMADLAVNLLVSAGLSMSMALSEAPSTLSDPYEEWGENFLPRDDSVPDFTVETTAAHTGGALALEPGLRLGPWQLSAPVELSWLDWRTEGVRFDWVVPAYTDTALYRFRDPAFGLSAGRWIGPAARPWIGASAFRWERLHSTHAGEVDFLGKVTFSTLDTEVLDRGWGGHLELGVALRPAVHPRRLAFVQGVRFSGRATRMGDGYTAAGLRLAWALGADFHPAADPLTEPLSGGEDP